MYLNHCIPQIGDLGFVCKVWATKIRNGFSGRFATPPNASILTCRISLFRHTWHTHLIPQMATAREKFKFQNTLLCLLKGLIGRKVVVELRNEHSVVGTIEDVDWLMNTSMTHARYTTPDGRIMAFEQFYIQGRNIRFVQIPNYVDIMETINTELRKFQVSILSKSVGLFHILSSKLGPAPGPQRS